MANLPVRGLSQSEKGNTGLGRRPTKQKPGAKPGAYEDTDNVGSQDIGVRDSWSPSGGLGLDLKTGNALNWRRNAHLHCTFSLRTGLSSSTTSARTCGSTATSSGGPRSCTSTISIRPTRARRAWGGHGT